MGKAVSCMCALMVVVSGCSPTQSGAGISNYPIANSQIFVGGYAQVINPTQSGKAPYSVYCEVSYTDSSKSNSDFNSAVVTVNGAKLVRTYDGTFQNVGDTMAFSDGDSLEFVIKHEKIGTIKEVLSVPQSVTGYSLSPGLPGETFQNSNTTFFLNWNPVNASYYSVEAFGYNTWETISLAQYWHSTLLDTATVVLQDSVGNACPYLAFLVESFNSLPLEGFAPGSGFEVSSKYYEVRSNMPGVSSSIRPYGRRADRIDRYFSPVLK